MNQHKQISICPSRSVAQDGRVICGAIASGDNEVSPNLCRECPVKMIACDHLRFSLQKAASRPITVRYATGRVEILDDQPARIGFLRAACVEKVVPVNSPIECVRCACHSQNASVPVAAPSTVAVGEAKVIPFPRRVAAAS
jgi:hypothetical protein